MNKLSNLNWLGRGPLVVHALLIAGYFRNKSKTSTQGKSWSDILFTAKNIAGVNIPSPEPSHYQNLTQKCKVLNVFWN